MPLYKLNNNVFIIKFIFMKAINHNVIIVLLNIAALSSGRLSM